MSARTCGRILALNRKLYGLRGPEATPREPKAMPFKAACRHQYWTVDIRYLDHQLGGGNVYCISIIDNFSRAIMASALSRNQATPAFLSVLFAAIERSGAPEMLVSDSGGVFKATHAKAIYAALGIVHTPIGLGQPWQSYIETHFNIQRRMADWRFARAESWAELQEVHKRWLGDYNYQEHWAHQRRADGRRSPADVLGWATGKRCSADALRRIFSVRSQRRLDQQGYVRFRNWRIYGERGLAGRQAAIWVTEEEVTIQFAPEALARYGVKYQRGRRQFRQVVATRVFETRYRSPQPLLPEVDPGHWRLAIELPGRQRRRLSRGTLVQEPLFSLEEAVGSR